MAYDRLLTIFSAAYFWDKVAHDGRVATKGGYPAKINGVTLTPGLPLDQIGANLIEEDCTHFVSCCIGQSKCTIKVGNRDITIHGGGLRISSPFKGAKVYGHTHVAQLVGELYNSKQASIIWPQFLPTRYDSTRNKILQNLRAGDLLAYARKPNPNHYEHMAILVGPDTIACHTYSRLNKDYTDVSFPWVTLLRLPPP
ncbi:MAG: hypothetical protein L0226_03625 [Acidobacteria bacterium]|nr:hypothetical protein [Acidobacteriota bacterium]